jgi:prepilin-type N-terminal cleavage/methylation domain-containing protein
MRASRRAERSDAGVTLLEVLVTITIMGIAFTALLSALTGIFWSGDAHRKVARAETLVRSYADAVDVAPYVNCAAAADYTGALLPAPPAGYTASIQLVEYWNGGATGSIFPGTTQATCVANGDKGVQRITVRVVQTDAVRGVTIDVVVVKRDPA